MSGDNIVPFPACAPQPEDNDNIQLTTQVPHLAVLIGPTGVVPNLTKALKYEKLSVLGAALGDQPNEDFSTEDYLADLILGICQAEDTPLTDLHVLVFPESSAADEGHIMPRVEAGRIIQRIREGVSKPLTMSSVRIESEAGARAYFEEAVGLTPTSADFAVTEAEADEGEQREAVDALGRFLNTIPKDAPSDEPEEVDVSPMRAAADRILDSFDKLDLPAPTKTDEARYFADKVARLSEEAGSLRRQNLDLAAQVHILECRVEREEGRVDRLLSLLESIARVR